MVSAMRPNHVQRVPLTLQSWIGLGGLRLRTIIGTGLALMLAACGSTGGILRRGLQHTERFEVKKDIGRVW